MTMKRKQARAQLGLPGAVVIGRNEGERLRRCLAALEGRVSPLVYVDSGSTDHSVRLARSMGADVVELDMTTPFTAARARNAGFERARALVPNLQVVHFVDGDCELEPRYLDAALATLEDASIGVVAGRLHERNVNVSIYNRLCDLEWDGAAGDVDWVGGNATYRASLFEAAGGFDPALIAGEEPELCLRVRRLGARIVRIEAPMALHDAAMTHFSQWWRRNLRAGHAYAEGAAMHGLESEHHFVRQTLRSVAYGAVLPLVSISLAPCTLGASLVLFAVYPLSTYRVYRSVRHRRSRRDSLTYGCFVTLAKVPEALGVLKYSLTSVRGQRSQLIEYK